MRTSSNPAPVRSSWRFLRGRVQDLDTDEQRESGRRREAQPISKIGECEGARLRLERAPFRGLKITARACRRRERVGVDVVLHGDRSGLLPRCARDGEHTLAARDDLAADGEQPPTATKQATTTADRAPLITKTSPFLRARGRALGAVDGTCRRADAGITAGANGTGRVPTACNAAVDGLDDRDAGALRHDLGELLVHAEGRGHAVLHVRELAAIAATMRGMSRVECLPGESI